MILTVLFRQRTVASGNKRWGDCHSLSLPSEFMMVKLFKLACLTRSVTMATTETIASETHLGNDTGGDFTGGVYECRVSCTYLDTSREQTARWRERVFQDWFTDDKKTSYYYPTMFSSVMSLYLVVRLCLEATFHLCFSCNEESKMWPSFILILMERLGLF